jgi:hypothetical protein
VCSRLWSRVQTTWPVSRSPPRIGGRSTVRTSPPVQVLKVLGARPLGAEVQEAHPAKFEVGLGEVLGDDEPGHPSAVSGLRCHAAPACQPASVPLSTRTAASSTSRPRLSFCA